MRHLRYILLAALTAALPLAASAEDLPFTPASTWVPIPVPSFSSGELQWANDSTHEALAVLDVPGIVNQAQLVAGLTMQARRSGGTIVSAGSPTICGKPANVLVTRTPSSNGDVITEEQTQASATGTYLLVYRRPASVTENAAIAAAMKNFCGSATLASLTPPPGWLAKHTQVLGMWRSADATPYTVTLARLDPQPNSALFKKSALETATNGNQSVKVVSSSESTLCGNPAVITTLDATQNGQHQIVEMETTQSKTSAYFLLYSRDASMKQDPDAIAAMKTLCAK